MHATHYCMSQAWEWMEYLYSNSFRNGGTRVLGSNVPTFGTYIHGLTCTVQSCIMLSCCSRYIIRMRIMRLERQTLQNRFSNRYCKKLFECNLFAPSGRPVTFAQETFGKTGRVAGTFSTNSCWMPTGLSITAARLRLSWPITSCEVCCV